ncbi:MAG: exodeoxyribonuclease VII large subunit, partial [Gammaproteobacteria bacterium]|nr:exodeoxyribonuclease VII large subunit [Gammaproteobacteria bacterium]
MFEREADVEAGRAVYSVSEVNRLARELIEGGFPSAVVEGEITGLKQYRSGHWYFSLQDRDAQLRCVMFRGNNISVGFRPADGDQVIARGSLTIYEARGDFQLKVTALEKSGSGELRRAFELLKARLQAEGLFEQEAQKPVGHRFRHIGVITSPSGAVYRDNVSDVR